KIRANSSWSEIAANLSQWCDSLGMLREHPIPMHRMHQYSSIEHGTNLTS
ncbi:hypothetical protein M378DRAFT_174407, partial [Amanita muscaria Koide BX008]